MFSRKEVKEALSNHVLLRLYADRVPAGTTQEPDAVGTVELRQKKFGTGALPLYALVRPAGEGFEIVRTDEQGLISDVPAFVRFLSE